MTSHNNKHNKNMIKILRELDAQLSSSRWDLIWRKLVQIL